MAKKGEYQIEMMRQEIALIHTALTWLKSELGIAIDNAEAIGSEDHVKMFDAMNPVIAMTQEFLLVQAIDQARSAGIVDELQETIAHQSEYMQTVQQGTKYVRVRNEIQQKLDS
jgi:hypothetical protein